MSMDSRLVCVAVIAGAHGVHGAVKVKSYTQVPEDFSAYGPLLGEDGSVILTPKNPRPVGKDFTMRSPEITTREQALEMKGTLLYVPRDVLPDTDDEDYFYYADLVGLDVKTSDGKRAGTIKAVHEFGAGDMLEIQPPKSAEKQASWFHPFTKAGVPKVDLKAGRVIIHIEEAVNGRDPNESAPKSATPTLD
ncbi:ribosome maturation factor RimM [Litorimonas sp. WD9-15]|uniref:ribosome maturation factor RimM n=1 Tax=Litorimonas sp. WD9-15 TaxID=3418716 RepID=UPI003D0329A9